MDFNSPSDLKRLEEQIFWYKPNIKTTVQKNNVSNRLRNQLLESKAVVRIQRMDTECENLVISLKQRVMLLQENLIPKDKGLYQSKTHKVFKYEDKRKSYLSSDSSDDETLSTLMSKQRIRVNQKMNTYQNNKIKAVDMQQADTSASIDTYLPLALRKKPRERRLSYKSYSSASTSHSNTNRIKLHSKQEHTVTTSGVDFHSEDMLAEQEDVDTTPTLHIKIPSLHRGNVHYIILDSLNFARKVFDYRANEVKQQQQQSISHNYKISKSHKKQIKCSSDPVLQQLTQQDQELELSQLIQDAIAEACNDETLQATSALENINNNFVDNYDAIANDTVITYSQSSQELSCSQNSNVINDMIGSITERSLPKKTRKYTKRTNEHKLNEPPKKRGRRPRVKNDAGSEKIQPQPPTKSNLAKYVEFFSNDCELLPGSSTPAASSTRSLPLVSSTTQNFEVVDQLPQQQAQQPITYYIDGDWANGGPCQLISTDGVSVDGRQLNQDANGQFHDFVNYIDNNGDSGNNVVASVLECNNSLPISIPLPIANLGLQNKNHYQVPHQTHHISTVVQNSAVPIINIQIPTLPSNIINSPAPKPAHTHKEVLDLSLKSSVNVSSTETLNINKKSNNSLETFSLTEDDDCLPLDLSVKGFCYTKENLTGNNCPTIDTQDEDFIRRLIEQSDFNYSSDRLKRGRSGESLTYEPDNTKSFEAALDMPLLDFDATNLEQLAAVEHAVTTSNNQEKSLTDKMFYNDFTNNEDSNYVSMTTAVNSTIENNLGFSDQSTSEIFNKLLDICPDNQFLTDINNELITNEDLNEIDFDHCKVENSTMCENKNPKSQKYQEEEEKEKEVCNEKNNAEKTNQEIDDNIIVEPSSSTSLTAQLDSLNNTADMTVELSLNSNFTENKNSIMIKNEKMTPTKSFKNTEIVVKNNEICNSTQQTSIENEEKETTIETTSKTYKNDQDTNNLCPSLNKEIVTEVESSVSIKKDEDHLTKMENLKLTNKKYIDIHDKYLHASPNIDTSTTNTNTQNANNVDNTKATYKNNQDTNNELPPSNSKYGNDVHLKELSTVKSKPKENVLFSVPKITLSEDDNLYTTDSDSSSGKFYDLNQFKSIDTDAKRNKKSYFSRSPTTCKNDNDKQAQSDNIERVNTPDSQYEISDPIVKQNINDLTDVDIKNSDISSTEKQHLSISCKEESESVKTDINIYNNEVEKLQNIKQGFNNDTSNNLECTTIKVQTLKCENRNIINCSENLTLLELECQLDNSLDFDEDFDDALSLATSCFDSPNDERFEDSFVNVDIATTAHTTEDSDSQQKNNCLNLSPIKDLKHFKIPKLSSSSKSPTKGEETQTSNSTPTDSLPKTVLPLNIERITRTVKNDLVTTFNPATEVTLAANNLDEVEETTILENLVLKVFGITCLPFLVDKCFGIAHCKLSHQLYDTDKVYLNLNTMDKIQVNLAYRVLYNHSKLFEIYFEVFCAYYSTKNERLKLLNMVNDCERYPEYGGLMIVVYEALVKCGFSRVNACRLILRRIREKTMATSIVEALVVIIMKSDWTMFTDFIEKFTQDVYKYNFRIGILEQMAPAVLNSKSPHLKQVFGKCVQTLHCDDTSLLLNSPALIQCVSLLATNTS